jgi:uncharacterized protein YuzE
VGQRPNQRIIKIKENKTMERVPSCDFMFIEQPDYQIIIDVSKNGDVIGVSWFKMPVESTSKEQINKICDILDKAKKIVINRKH